MREQVHLVFASANACNIAGGQTIKLMVLYGQTQQLYGQTNYNNLLEKDGGRYDISIYKDLRSGIQGLVSAY